MKFESIIILLLDSGIDINIEGTTSHSMKINQWLNTEFKSTLKVATTSYNIFIIQLLLDHCMALPSEYIEDSLIQALITIKVENKLKMIDSIVSKGLDIKSMVVGPFHSPATGMATLKSCINSSLLAPMNRVIETRTL